MRWLDSVTDSLDMNVSRLQERVKDRGAWYAAVHGASKSCPRTKRGFPRRNSSQDYNTETLLEFPDYCPAEFGFKTLASFSSLPACPTNYPTIT